MGMENMFNSNLKLFKLVHQLRFTDRAKLQQEIKYSNFLLLLLLWIYEQK